MGRKKGTPNKTTRLLKEAVIQAAEETGNPASGNEGGTVGYCRWLAETEPKSFATLLGRVLPLQITGDDDDGPLKVIIQRQGEDTNKGK